jgi:hypothetical protein
MSHRRATSHPRATVPTAVLTTPPRARPWNGRATIRWLAVAMLAIALAACQSGEQGGQPDGESKSPFATGNVSVAPQIEGRAAAPTPVPAPRPTLEP